MWACTALGSQAVSQAPPWAILPSPRTSWPRDTRAPDRTRCGLRCPPLPPNRPPMSAGPGPREPLPPGHIHIALPPLPVSGSERAAPPPYLGGEISSPTLPAALSLKTPAAGTGPGHHSSPYAGSLLSGPPIPPLSDRRAPHGCLPKRPSSSATTSMPDVPPASTRTRVRLHLLPAGPCTPDTPPAAWPLLRSVERASLPDRRSAARAWDPDSVLAHAHSVSGFVQGPPLPLCPTNTVRTARRPCPWRAPAHQRPWPRTEARPPRAPSNQTGPWLCDAATVLHPALVCCYVRPARPGASYRP